MDRLHVQGVPQDKSNVVLGTQVRQPVPGKHALDGNDQPVAIRSDRIKKDLGIGRIIAMQERLTARVENAQIHRSGVQIDAAVESVLLLVEAHVMVSLRWAWASEP